MNNHRRPTMTPQGNDLIKLKEHVKHLELRLEAALKDNENNIEKGTKMSQEQKNLLLKLRMGQYINQKVTEMAQNYDNMSEWGQYRFQNFLKTLKF